MKSFVEFEIIDGVVYLMMDKVTAGALCNMVGSTSCSDSSPINDLYGLLYEDKDVEKWADYFLDKTSEYRWTPEALNYEHLWPEEHK